jgi:PIN domain nuclease of toxin-antitoxin system
VTTYVTDTHSLIWYLGDPDRLGAMARQAFAEAAAGRARIIVSVIVLAEIVFIVERRRVRADTREIIRRVRSSPPFEIVPLRLGTVLRLQTLAEIPEMHDRILVAETLARNGKLITRDRAIAKAGIVPTIW